MQSEMVKISGSCLCGGVRFRAVQFDAPMQCHCSQCRRWAGHAWPAVGATQVKITGRKHLRWYQSSEEAQRGFCGVCGSTLFYRRDRAEHIAVSLGAVEEPTRMTLAGHIFTAHKGDYYEIADSLPQEAEA